MKISYLLLLVMLLVVGCSPTEDRVLPNASTAITSADPILEPGSNAILLNVVEYSENFRKAISRGKMRFKPLTISQEAFMSKATKVDFDNRDEVIDLLKEMSTTPEIHADYVMGLRVSYKALFKLNPQLVSADKGKMSNLLAVATDAQLVEYNNRPKTFEWDTFMGPGVNDNFGYRFRHQSDNDGFNASVPIDGGGNANEAMSLCSQACGVSLGRCFDDFKRDVAIALATSLIPGGEVAGAVVLATAIYQNYVCKERSFQDLDICAIAAGFYKP